MVQLQIVEVEDSAEPHALPRHTLQIVKTAGLFLQCQKGNQCILCDSQGSRFAASERGDSEVLKAWLSEDNPDVKYVRGVCMVLFTRAAERGHTDILRTVVEYGPNEVTDRDQFGWTFLHFASRYGLLDSCELLLEKGSEVDAVTIYGETALAHAVRAPLESEGFEVVRLLVAQGAAIETRDVTDRGPLCWAQTEEKVKELVFLRRCRDAGSYERLANLLSRPDLVVLRRLCECDRATPPGDFRAILALPAALFLIVISFWAGSPIGWPRKIERPEHESDSEAT